MPNFIYEAIDKQGTKKSGELQADSKAGVLDHLSRQDLTPLSVREKGVVSGNTTLGINLFERVTAIDRILLTKHLSAVVKSGISLHEALDILIADTEKPIVKKILTDAKFNLERGQPMSATFESWGKYFSPVFVGLVKAGEVSGNLEKTLDQLGDQLTRDNDLVKKVKSAMIYPAILIVASTAVVMVLLLFVLPRLATSFAQSGVTLPITTRILLGISNAVSYSPALTIGFFVALLVAGIYFWRSENGRKRLNAFAFKVPILRNLIKKIALTRFARTLGSLLSSGIPIMQSLEILSVAIGNIVYKNEINSIRNEIKRGIPLSDLLRKNENLFPHLLVSMISVGERTGTLESGLKTVANFYDEEVDRELKSLVSLIEPAMLLIMGLIIAAIAVSILLPIYQLVGSLR